MPVPRLPNWPPPDDEQSGDLFGDLRRCARGCYWRRTCGIDRARQYIAWIKQHAGPVLEEAERMLNDRYPGAEIHRSAATIEMMATRGLSERMQGLSIGCVWCSFMAGSFAMVDIVITREGYLVAKPGLNMRR
jgi:hypothetical protein